MFELADYLVGIYKVQDCTQSLTIQNYDKQRVLGIGEEEVEKENYSDGLNISATPEKQTQAQNLSENVSQNKTQNGMTPKKLSMDVSKNATEADESMDTSENELKSPNESQVLSQND